MYRKLLLIGNPGGPDVNYSPSVESVLKRYKDFFKSEVGGYWYAVFNRRRQGFIRKTRWIGDSAFNYLLKAGTTDGFVVDNDGDEDGTPSGISVLCIDFGKEQHK